MFRTETELDKFSEKSATSIFRTEQAQDGGRGFLRKIATRGITSLENHNIGFRFVV